MAANNQAYGSLAGGAAGAAIAGPMGAGVGMMAGGMIGGMFDSESKPWYDESWFNTRKNEIGEFANNLAAARSRYLTSLGNMYNQAYSRFSGNAEAGFASRGLAVNGGAFASALAKKSADYQAQLEPQAFEAERSDLKSVNDAYGQLFGQRVAAKSGAGNLQYQGDRQDSQAMGGFAASLVGLGLQNKASSPRGYNAYYNDYGRPPTNFNANPNIHYDSSGNQYGPNELYGGEVTGGVV